MSLKVVDLYWCCIIGLSQEIGAVAERSVFDPSNHGHRLTVLSLCRLSSTAHKDILLGAPPEMTPTAL